MTRWQAKYGTQARESSTSEGNGAREPAGKARRADGLDCTRVWTAKWRRRPVFREFSPTDGDWLGGRQAGRQVAVGSQWQWQRQSREAEVERSRSSLETPTPDGVVALVARVKGQVLEELLSVSWMRPRSIDIPFEERTASREGRFAAHRRSRAEKKGSVVVCSGSLWLRTAVSQVQRFAMCCSLLSRLCCSTLTAR